MSWDDKIKDMFYIRTGDGKIYATQGAVDYKMHFRGAVKNLTFNTEGFDFVGVEGTYVAREQAQGTQYPIEIYFEGENHIEISKEFEISSRNKNAWVLGHPIFGQITCQPLSLEFDSTALNITKITGTLWESTEVKYPEYTINEKNQIELKRVAMTTAAFFFTATDVTETTQKSAFSLSDLIDINYSKLPATNEQAVELKNKIREVSSAIEEILLVPGRYMESLYSLLTFVIEVEDNIVFKIKKLSSIFDGLKSINDVSIFEPTASAILTVATELAMNTNYEKRSDVADTAAEIENIHDSMNDYYEDNNIIPNYEMALAMDFMTNVTIGNLYKVGMSAKQERVMILEKDSNPILLSHRFYGFSDDSLDKFIEENNISMNEMFIVKKGRRLIWYV